MSFTITMYNCISDNRYVTKTLTTKGSIINDNFRDEFDVINPIFIIQTDGTNPVTILNANAQYYGEQNFKNDIFGGEINYLSIVTGNLTRYYYILNCSYIQNNLISIECHEDVLMTFKTKIKTCDAIVRRNENAYNLYIKDSKIGVYEKPIVRQKVFTTGFTNTSLTYLITTVGKAPRIVSNNPLATVPFTITGFNSSDATNGGEIVWLPGSYCEYTNHKNSVNYFDFKLIPTGDWVICNKGALYGTNIGGWCIAEVTGYDDNAGTLSLVSIHDGSFGDSFDVYTNMGALFNAYSWSVGGNYDSQSGAWGTNLYINGSSTLTNRCRSYRETTTTQLQTTSNTLMFYYYD